MQRKIPPSDDSAARELRQALELVAFRKAALPRAKVWHVRLPDAKSYYTVASNALDPKATAQFQMLQAVGNLIKHEKLKTNHARWLRMLLPC